MKRLYFVSSFHSNAWCFAHETKSSLKQNKTKQNLDVSYVVTWELGTHPRELWLWEVIIGEGCLCSLKYTFFGLTIWRMSISHFSKWIHWLKQDGARRTASPWDELRRHHLKGITYTNNSHYKNKLSLEHSIIRFWCKMDSEFDQNTLEVMTRLECSYQKAAGRWRWR